MERALGLMAGAGVLPGRAAQEAAREGWRVVAFTFDEAPGLYITVEEGVRFWALDAETCGRVLATLQQAGFLTRAQDGRYHRAPEVEKARSIHRVERT